MIKDERIKLCKDLFEYMKLKSVIVLSKKGFYMIPRKERLYELLKNDDLFKDRFTLYVKEFRTLEEALYCIVHLDDYSNHLCQICNETCRFDKIYRPLCNKKECFSLLHKSEEVSQKRIKTNRRKYGVDNPSKSSIIREKRRKSMIEHYGSEEYFNSEDYKRVMIENFGVDNPSKSEEVRKKCKTTNLEKYGVEFTLQNQDIKRKSMDTCIERYGVEHPAQNEEVMAKMKQTNLELYGVENAMQNEDIKTKWKESYHINNSINYYPIEDPNDKIILEVLTKMKEELNLDDVSIKDIYLNDGYFSKFINLLYSLRSRPLTLNEVSDIFNVYPQTIKRYIDRLSLISLFHIKDSKLELKIKELLDSIGFKDYKRHDRTIKNDTEDGNLEIDLYLEELKLGFEINDVSSHNVKKKDPMYHYMKTEKAKKLGIRIIHIWEWELADVKLWNRLSKWILHIILSNKININSNNCVIKEVSIKEEKDFLNNFHIQGYIKSDICLGLYYNNELIQLMSFGKPRYNKKYEYELLRLAVRYGYSIDEGSTLLLRYFKTTYNPSSLISYCDLSKFSGETYIKLGFTLEELTKPQIIWFNEITGRHFSQTSLNMIGADKLLDVNYGKGTNNEDIVRKYGYKAIYNCGLAVYTLHF